MLAPELLTRICPEQAARYILDDRYWAQEKLDGERLLVRRSGHQIEGRNKQGQTTAVDLALTSALLSLTATDFTLDGEQLSSGYNCFDLLRVNHEDLTSYPYETRYAVLQCFKPCSFTNVIPTWTTKSEKEENIFELIRRGAEGVVFRDRLAPYRSGRAGQHFKWPFRQAATVRIRSVDPIRNTARIEMFDGTRWIEVSGIKVERGSVQPGDYVEVSYASASDSLHLVRPVFLRLRRDVSDDDCSTQQLKFTGRWAPSGLRESLAKGSVSE